MIQEEKLKEAQRLYKTANADQRYVLESLFPELRESEDEKIRKEIVDYINRLTVTPNNIDRYNSWIAWLEKQVPKSKWTEEDERNLNMAIYFMRSENTPYSPTDVEPVVEWLCWLKQRMEE